MTALSTDTRVRSTTRRKTAIAYALSAICGTLHAQGVLDPTAIVAQRIKASPQAMAKLGEGVDLTNLVFVDRQRSGAVVFDFAKGRSAVPGAIVLQDQTANGCVQGGYQQNVEVKKTTQSSEQMSVTNSMGGSTTVEVSFDSPIASASVSQTFEYSQANTRGSARASETSWSSSVNVPVPEGRRIRVQFQVATVSYRDVPWYADVVVDGQADVSYAGNFEVCAWEHSVWRGGKKCWVTRDRLAQPLLWSEAYDNGKPIGNPMFRSDTGISSVRTRGTGKVSFFSHGNFGGWRWEQVNTKDFPDLSVGYGSGANPNDRFMSMIIEPASGTRRMPITELLPAADQRSFRISGTYQSVDGVEGNWVAVDDGPAQCGGIIARPGTPPARTSGVSGAGGTASGGVNGNLVQNNLDAAAPIKGTLLLQGVRPTRR